MILAPLVRRALRTIDRYIQARAEEVGLAA